MSNMKKPCELCDGAARIYCEADGAILCLDCDDKVHSANFLVAKHYRYLLCQLCQSPTPWKASGTTLGPSVAICTNCVANRSQRGRRRCDESEPSGAESDEYDCSSSGTEDDDDGDGDRGSNEEEGGDNQVVPW